MPSRGHDPSITGIFVEILRNAVSDEMRNAMIDITRLSSHYEIRTLTDSDVDIILDLCQHNTLFYKYTEARPTREQIRNDMRITPPGITLSDKYFIGFFEGQELVAVMDLIGGYPKPENAYIGFFMMNQEYQGKQIGSAIIRDTADYLRKIGKTAIRLAIDKGNPQSAHFWKKNGFKVIFEVDVNGWKKLVAEKPLQKRIIAACGNDCSVCLRYVAHPFEKSEAEMRHTAELWMRIGYRDHVAAIHEISCAGCKPENWCRYRVVSCCEERGVKTCAECVEYLCENIKECFEVTMSFEPKCREVCTEDEYEHLKKAFFEKEKNLSEIRRDFSDRQ